MRAAPVMRSELHYLAWRLSLCCCLQTVDQDLMGTRLRRLPSRTTLGLGTAPRVVDAARVGPASVLRMAFGRGLVCFSDWRSPWSSGRARLGVRPIEF